MECTCEREMSVHLVRCKEPDPNPLESDGRRTVCVSTDEKRLGARCSCLPFTPEETEEDMLLGSSGDGVQAQVVSIRAQLECVHLGMTAVLGFCKKMDPQERSGQVEPLERRLLVHWLLTWESRGDEEKMPTSVPKTSQHWGPSQIICLGDSSVDTLAVFMASSGTTDIANCNSPATPPNTLNLRSSHNELLNAEIKHSDTKNSTPPKCRKKYALTNIQAAMGLSDPAAQPLLGNGSANIKLVKNGENQLRKAAEQGQQDPNKNISPAAVINITSEKLEGKEPCAQEPLGCEIVPSQPRRTKSFLNYYADLETSTREQEQDLGNHQGPGEEKVQPGQGQAPAIIGNGDLLLQKPNKPQSSPEDGQVATVSSSPETKKDHPKTGAKTDCALHRIQNLAPSDEESSWTTLSHDSASPSSPDEAGTLGKGEPQWHMVFMLPAIRQQIFQLTTNVYY
ncbi:Amyloid beta A4 precursor protein-binding family B member 2 [Heterocephalus glaber]|uniref:Amyloid beta A4 protein-binding family B member 2 n=1 Tax=Heterocephalus glaber TaxID=10181 RepID=G5C140_HETGA|nr:Amyloid beta A4 precursor protein-binding family B member 2 [Heterocephalus glaber]